MEKVIVKDMYLNPSLKDIVNLYGNEFRSKYKIPYSYHKVLNSFLARLVKLYKNGGLIFPKGKSALPDDFYKLKETVYQKK